MNKKYRFGLIAVIFLFIFTSIPLNSAAAPDLSEEINETEILEQLRSIFKPSDTNIEILSIGQESQHQTKDATLLLRKIYGNWDKLSNETKAEINLILLRPNLPITYSTQHFIFHFIDYGSHSSNWSYIAKIANYMEHAWTTEIYSFGFDEPADTLIDVYIYDMGLEVGGFTQFFLGSITIDLNTESRIGTDNRLKIITAHEFFHAIQTSYDYWDEAWILEGTAKWMEDAVYDDINDYFGSTWVKLTNPDDPITCQSTGQGDPCPYSAVLFWKFLSEKYGTDGAGGRCYQHCDDSDCGADIIEGLMDKTRTANGIEAVSNVVNERYLGTTWYDLFWGFWITNYVKELGNPYGSGWYDYCEDGTFGYPQVAVRYSDALNLGETYTTPSPSRVDYWAANYIVINPSPQIGNIRISLDGQNSGFLDPHDFGLSLVLIKKNENDDVTGIVFHPIVYLDSNNDATVSYTNDEYDEVVIIISGLFHGGLYELSVTGENICQDNDGDGYDKKEPICTTGTDCDDSDPNINPLATETCNGRDDDCNGQIDDIDQDGDGYRPLDCGGSDCNDGNPDINPGQAEDCGNGVDDDCDGAVDGGDPDCMACSCTGWQDQGCGQSPCSGGEMKQTRACTPPGCDTQTRCISHESCGACDSSSYTSCSGAHEMQIPAGGNAYVLQHLCGDQQFFRITTTSVCDIRWETSTRGIVYYELYTKWDGPCPSTGSWDCYDFDWTKTNVCEAQGLPPGTYYAMAKYVEGSGTYSAYVQVDCPPPCEPQPEICDGQDNNCDGQVDENLYQSCGSGACLGTMQCSNGAWGDCSSSGQDAGICALCGPDGNPFYDGSQGSDCPPTLCPSDACGLGGCGLNIFADFPSSVPNDCSALHACTNNACTAACEADGDGDGWSPTCGDCNDTDSGINPDAEEVCDGQDNNCDNETDENCIEGDMNGDCAVDILDLAAVGLAFGSQPGDPGWNPRADLNGDDRINIFDLAAVGINYGNTC